MKAIQNLKGMLKNRHLALAVTDAAMGEVLCQLAYKSVWFGSSVQKVGRLFASSKTCSACGYVHHNLALSDRTWVCAGCGTRHQRDWNAAKNIEAEALRLAFA